MKTCTTLLLAACWGVVVLSAVSVSAGAGGNGVRLNGLSLNGVSQSGVGKSDGLRDSVAQGVPAPQAETPSATIPRQVELADAALASTAAKRAQLTYLVRCALPEDIALYAQQGTERFTFRGSMGLAPRWQYEAMTPSEERWVSACLLAHVNYFGKHVLVSMRATTPPVPVLEASDEEQQTFSIFEGGFSAISLPPSRSPIPVGASARPHTRVIQFCRIVFVPRRRARQRLMASPSSPAAFC